MDREDFWKFVIWGTVPISGALKKSIMQYTTILDKQFILEKWNKYTEWIQRKTVFY